MLVLRVDTVVAFDATYAAWAPRFERFCNAFFRPVDHMNSPHVPVLYKRLPNVSVLSPLTLVTGIHFIDKIAHLVIPKATFTHKVTFRSLTPLISNEALEALLHQLGFSRWRDLERGRYEGTSIEDGTATVLAAATHAGRYATQTVTMTAVNDRLVPVVIIPLFGAARRAPSRSYATAAAPRSANFFIQVPKQPSGQAKTSPPSSTAATAAAPCLTDVIGPA